MWYRRSVSVEVRYKSDNRFQLTFDNFRTFVEYLTLVIVEGGQLTDDAYEKYLKECEEAQKNMEKWDVHEGNMDMKAMMKFVYLHIL